MYYTVASSVISTLLLAASSISTAFSMSFEIIPVNQMGHTDIATTRGSYYFNRNSEDQNKQEISRIINF